MPRPDSAWLDAQYNNRARIPAFASILQGWAEDSAAARERWPHWSEQAYGADATERADVFLPAPGTAARPHPVLVYIHGGYWRALDKSDQSHIALPYVQRGAVVVIPNYALCPAVSIEHIVRQMVAALAWVWRQAPRWGADPARITVAGHSAGGHLAAMMLACRWSQVGADLPADLVRCAVAISGLFDLEPLRHAPFLAPDLRLTQASARKLSPAHMPAPAHGQLLAVVGGAESEEFQRQNRLLRDAWGVQRVPVCEAIPGRHHMNVLDEMVVADSRLQGLVMQAAGL